jgi:serine/threonine protein kinase
VRLVVKLVPPVVILALIKGGPFRPFQQKKMVEELKTELELVARLQHKNLVRLIGVCLERDEKLLVYEYMPNRNLDTIIFGK